MLLSTPHAPLQLACSYPACLRLPYFCIPLLFTHTNILKVLVHHILSFPPTTTTFSLPSLSVSPSLPSSRPRKQNSKLMEKLSTDFPKNDTNHCSFCEVMNIENPGSKCRLVHVWVESLDSLAGIHYLAPKIRPCKKWTGEILYRQKYPNLWYVAHI